MNLGPRVIKIKKNHIAGNQLGFPNTKSDNKYRKSTWYNTFILIDNLQTKEIFKYYKYRNFVNQFIKLFVHKLLIILLF